MRLRKGWEGPRVIVIGQILPPLGPGMADTDLHGVTRLERWDSEWGDAQVQTEWRLYRGPKLVETRRIAGV